MKRSLVDFEEQHVSVGAVCAVLLEPIGGACVTRPARLLTWCLVTPRRMPWPHSKRAGPERCRRARSGKSTSTSLPGCYFVPTIVCVFVW